MKPRIQAAGLSIFAIGTLLALSGCSSTPIGGGEISGKEISPNGPTVLNVRTIPSTVELTQDFRPVEKPEIVADVKDFGAQVNRVVLRFSHVPMQIPMKNVGGTTWRAELSNQQLRSLAVSGKTITYDATVEATDSRGQVGVSSSPVTVAIKTPSLNRKIG